MAETPNETIFLKENSPPAPMFLTVKDMAALLNCSTRTVYRLIDSGLVPRPVKFGALLRWMKTNVEQWMAAGCPKCRKGGVR